MENVTKFGYEVIDSLGGAQSTLSTLIQLGLKYVSFLIHKISKTLCSTWFLIKLYFQIYSTNTCWVSL